MWTGWTTSVVLAIAVGGLFFKGPAWDHYTIGIMILAFVVLAALLRERIGSGASRRMLKTALPHAAPPPHGEDEAMRQRITATQARIRQRRARHSWCIRFP
jgi:hypothetical protein